MSLQIKFDGLLVYILLNVFFSQNHLVFTSEHLYLFWVVVAFELDVIQVLYFTVDEAVFVCRLAQELALGQDWSTLIDWVHLLKCLLPLCKARSS